MCEYLKKIANSSNISVCMACSLGGVVVLTLTLCPLKVNGSRMINIKHNVLGGKIRF